MSRNRSFPGIDQARKINRSVEYTAVIVSIAQLTVLPVDGLRSDWSSSKPLRRRYDGRQANTGRYCLAAELALAARIRAAFPEEEIT